MPNKTTIYLESTRVPAARTISDIMDALMRSKHVAEVTHVILKPIAVRFLVRVGDRLQWFSIRAHPLGVKQQWNDIHGFKQVSSEKLEMIAWRQRYEYVRALLMQVESGQETILGVFMPLAVRWDEKLNREVTASEDFQRQLALPAPTGESN